MRKILIGSLMVVLFFGSVIFGVNAASNAWLSNGADIYTDNSDAKVGIGVNNPQARLHIKNILNDSGVPVADRAPGLLFELPSITDPSNNTGPAMQWERSGNRDKWRQYFNGGENGWALTLNAPWDYATRQWLNKDGDGMSAYMRFDVSKGDTGQNAFEIGFAPGGSGAPKWNEGAHYAFYDGKAGNILDKDSTRYPAKLLIEGRRDMDTILALKGSGTSVDLMISGDPAQHKLFKIQQPENGNLNAPSKELLVIDTDTGNVGIGLTPNNHKLSVAGAAGLTTGTTWTQISDARFKDVQSELKGGSLERIMSLRPVSYQWNSAYQDKYGKKDGLNYGFIAQEVQKVIPEFITQDNEGYFWYNPSGFEAILTAAVQEQEEEMADLKAELKDIKTRLNLVQ